MKPRKLEALLAQCSIPLRQIARELLGDVLDAERVVNIVFESITPADLPDHPTPCTLALAEAVVVACLGSPANDFAVIWEPGPEDPHPRPVPISCDHFRGRPANDNGDPR